MRSSWARQAAARGRRGASSRPTGSGGGGTGSNNGAAGGPGRSRRGGGSAAVSLASGDRAPSPVTGLAVRCRGHRITPPTMPAATSARPRACRAGVAVRRASGQRPIGIRCLRDLCLRWISGTPSRQCAPAPPPNRERPRDRTAAPSGRKRPRAPLPPPRNARLRKPSRNRTYARPTRGSALRSGRGGRRRVAKLGAVLGRAGSAAAVATGWHGHIGASMSMTSGAPASAAASAPRSV